MSITFVAPDFSLGGTISFLARRMVGRRPVFQQLVSAAIRRRHPYLTPGIAQKTVVITCHALYSVWGFPSHLLMTTPGISSARNNVLTEHPQAVPPSFPSPNHSSRIKSCHCKGSLRCSTALSKQAATAHLKDYLLALEGTPLRSLYRWSRSKLAAMPAVRDCLLSMESRCLSFGIL